MAVLLLFALTGNVALAQTEPDLSDKGQPGSDEEKKSGSPDGPNDWGSVVTQTAIPSEEEGVEAGTYGQHASDPLATSRVKALGTSLAPTRAPRALMIVGQKIRILHGIVIRGTTYPITAALPTTPSVPTAS